MCMCAVQVSYSISSTGLSAPIGHQACVSYTLRQCRTPWILILEVLASVLCAYICVCVFLCTSPHPLSVGEGVGSAVGGAVCWNVVWLRVLRLKWVCVHLSVTVRTMKALVGRVYLCMRSEVNKYWQWIISSGRVAGGFDGADWTQQQEKIKIKIHVGAHAHSNAPLPFLIFMLFSSSLAFKWLLEQGSNDSVVIVTLDHNNYPAKIIKLPSTLPAWIFHGFCSS